MVSDQANALLLAEQAEGEYRELLPDGPFNPGAMLYSEMLLVFALLDRLGCTHIVESGRFRGDSTEVFWRMGLAVDSIELTQGDAHDLAARARLEGVMRSSLRLHYGDGEKLGPALVDPSRNTIVVIDGPKGRAQLRMARACLVAGAAAVALHDTAPQKRGGQLLKASRLPYITTAEPSYVERFRYLDEPCWAALAGNTVMPEPYRWRGRHVPTYAGTLSVVLGPRVRGQL